MTSLIEKQNELGAAASKKGAQAAVSKERNGGLAGSYSGRPMELYLRA